MANPTAPIVLHADRIPSVIVTDGNTERPADPTEYLAHILASQLRTEQLVAEMVAKVGPTMEGLARNPLLSKLFH